MNQELFFSPICGRQNNNLSKMSTNLMLQIHECVTQLREMELSTRTGGFQKLRRQEADALGRCERTKHCQHLDPSLATRVIGFPCSKLREINLCMMVAHTQKVSILQPVKAKGTGIHGHTRLHNKPEVRLGSTKLSHRWKGQRRGRKRERINEKMSLLCLCHEVFSRRLYTINKQILLTTSNTFLLTDS